MAKNEKKGPLPPSRFGKATLVSAVPLDPTDPDSAVAGIIQINVLMFKKDLENIKDALKDARAKNEPLDVAGYLTIRPASAEPDNAAKNWLKFEPLRAWENRGARERTAEAVADHGGEELVLDGDLPF